MSGKRQVSKRAGRQRALAAVERDFMRAATLVSHLRSGVDLTQYQDLSSRKTERIRVSRGVEDVTGLGKIAIKLEQLHKEGVISRKTPSRMALTVFDTASYKQPLPHGHSEESATTLLKSSAPGLFKPFTADVKGLKLFGHQEYPHIGITFATVFLDLEELEVAKTLFPAIKTGKIISHLSVARTFSRERALSTVRVLEEFLPSQISFKVGNVAVGLEERPFC